MDIYDICVSNNSYQHSQMGPSRLGYFDCDREGNTIFQPQTAADVLFVEDTKDFRVCTYSPGGPVGSFDVFCSKPIDIVATCRFDWESAAKTRARCDGLTNHVPGEEWLGWFVKPNRRIQEEIRV